MGQVKPSPLAEALERMGEAARAYLDGPIEQLRAAAERASQPNYGVKSATADAAGCYVQLARAWWLGLGKGLDAMAILAVPPGDGYRFDVRVPPAVVPCKVHFVSKTWTWEFDPEPAGVKIRVRQELLMPPNDTVVLDMTPVVLAGEPSWKVQLEIVPVAGGEPTTVTVRLNASTQVWNSP